MFQLGQYRDKFGRTYTIVKGTPDDEKAEKVVALIMTHNCEDYIGYCLDALKNQVDGFYVIDDGSTDCTLKVLKERGIVPLKRKFTNYSGQANAILKKIPKNVWVFYVNPDEILYDLPDKYIGKLARFLTIHHIRCADIRFPDFVYNYSTLVADYDWGDGVGNYWTARRLFFYTGNEKFVNPVHFNISNVKGEAQFNYEHTGEWNGTVVKLPEVMLFHYGKLRGVEFQRKKGPRLLNGEMIAKGLIATKPYNGKHPSVMKL